MDISSILVKLGLLFSLATYSASSSTASPNITTDNNITASSSTASPQTTADNSTIGSATVAKPTQTSTEASTSTSNSHATSTNMSPTTSVTTVTTAEISTTASAIEETSETPTTEASSETPPKHTTTTVSPNQETSETITSSSTNEAQTVTSGTSNPSLSTTTTADQTSTAAITTVTSNPCDSKHCANGNCTVDEGRTACVCEQGYTGDLCETDIDECESSPCHGLANCTNNNGSYTCQCKEGFTGNGTVCDDINECNTTEICDKNAVCTNTNGSYTCSCNHGWTGNGTDCIDINECNTTGICDKNAVCTNTNGSYTCSCNHGWTGNGTDCMDKDECSNLTTNNFDPNADCTNTNGSYTCNYKMGWAGDGRKCEDINECISKPCHVWANCNNTDGSFSCTCESGFTGNGTHCEDIDECGGNVCYANNTLRCINLAQNYFCMCKRGWKGVNCTEEDDLCDAQRNPCSPNATCYYNETDTICTCSGQFKGNGTVCFRRVLIEEYENSNKVVGDDAILGPYDVPGGIPYNGQMYYSIYVSMDGYLSLGQRFNRKYPDIERIASFPPIIAPLWADIETKNETETEGLYVNSTLDPTEINKYFGKRLNNPRFSFLATWIGAVPYPYKDNNFTERANFQVVLITNGSQTEMMFNYDQEFFTWKRSPGRKIAVGFTNHSTWNLIANDDNFTKMNEISNEIDPDIRGRYVVEISNDDPKLQFEAECFSWMTSNDFSNLREEIVNADRCPCSLDQALRDRRFKNIGNNLYQSRFARGSRGSKQNCQYSPNGALLTGVPNGGYLEINIESLSTNDGHTKCCMKSTRLCNQFYQIVPSQNCSGYTPPSWSLTWGDPHIQTIDGQTYTFNGRGEYVLLEYQNNTGSEKTEIQVRTDFVSENRKDATVFVGLAAKVGEGPIIELNLDRNSKSLSLYVNGLLNSTFNGTNLVEIDFDNIQVFNDSDYLIIATKPGINVKVEVSNILDITTSVPRMEPFVGKTKGLLGNNDGNDKNDFVTRNNTSLPANANESTIYTFASSWRVSKNASLFNYTIGKGYDYYNNATITEPIFVSEINIAEYMINKCGGEFDLSGCDNNTECITDSVISCDINVGQRTRQQAEKAASEAAILSNEPPRLTTDAELEIYLGYKFDTTWTRNLSIFFADNDKVNIELVNVSTSLQNLYTFENDIFNLSISSLQRDITEPIYIKFLASDKFNASTEYWPTIYFCGCERQEECDYSRFTGNTQSLDRFYVASCNCSDNYTGDYCETKNCNCYNVVNWDNCTCSCPQGMVQPKDDNKKCYDVNECDKVPPVCGQICENTLGSYNCSCRDGYRLNTDGSCSDIDECQEDTRLCQNAGQYCENAEGNFTCKCSPGYAAESNGSCVRVSQSFAGKIVFSVDESYLNGTLKDLAVAWVTEIFSQLTELKIEVHVKERHTRRKKRAEDFAKSYEIDFVISTSGENASYVEGLFNNYKERHSELPVVINGIPVQLNNDESSLFTDDDNGICNIPERIDCDSISTVCVSLNGAFTCRCKQGFERLPASRSRCSDIDECKKNTTICPTPNGNCTNTPGSYDCTCIPGYMFDGIVCQDTCEPNPCNNGGVCTHGSLEGQYICKCDDKWTGARCETENSEISKLRTIAIAVGASVGCVCLLLLIAILGMYRRHKKRRFPYSRRPLSTMDDFDNGLSNENLRYHKDMPIDDGDSYNNGTTFDMPRIPRAKLRDSEYNTIEDKSELGGAERSVSGQDNEESRPIASDKRQSAESDKFGKSNPSFLHNEDGQRTSTGKGRNHYEYF